MVLTTKIVIKQNIAAIKHNEVTPGIEPKIS